MQHIRAHVFNCGGTAGCKANGSEEIQLTFARELQKFGLQDEVMVVETGCHGFCEPGPLVIVYPEGTFYCGVKPEDVKTIVEERLHIKDASYSVCSIVNPSIRSRFRVIRKSASTKSSIV